MKVAESGAENDSIVGGINGFGGDGVQPVEGMMRAIRIKRRSTSRLVDGSAHRGCGDWPVRGASRGGNGCGSL